MAAVTLPGTTVTVATGAGAATLMLASPVFPSLIARTRAVPALSARTVAEAPAVLAIDNTDGSVLDHDTARLLSAFPAASLTSAAKVALSPTVRLALPGTTVTVATGAGTATLIVACPVFPSLVAWSTAVPAARARTGAGDPSHRQGPHQRRRHRNRACRRAAGDPGDGHRRQPDHRHE